MVYRFQGLSDLQGWVGVLIVWSLARGLLDEATASFSPGMGVESRAFEMPGLKSSPESGGARGGRYP